ncbi:hypothetical protein RZO55_20380 [Clostridium boliviensis]|uniref:Uncharacterized protein n=1 Tax=Clostridium boliviensis TaxID=318465 RepID=A0ABU4GSL8_9CLOT|nr:hypothetical protein [Clostridium boliviensis]MDW2799933.1 hypothetical protein [Clostridium boliviensis]
MGNLENQDFSEIRSLLMRAIKDAEFKKMLISDTDKVLEEYNFTEVQKILIKSLREDDIDKLSPENLEEYFSADSAVYTPDVEEELLMEEAGEDDI